MTAITSRTTIAIVVNIRVKPFQLRAYYSCNILVTSSALQSRGYGITKHNWHKA